MADTVQCAYQIVRFDNGNPMRSGIPFDYIDPALPALRQLRQQEGLDELAQAATSEYDLIRRVMQHVKEQWDHSFHSPMQHANALEVLEDVRSGLRGNFCVYFTHVLLQSLWALGIPCRYLHVGAHHWYNHSTAECWSNEFRKWILVDSDFNLCVLRPEVLPSRVLHAVRRFVPQHAREIQQAQRNGSLKELRFEQGPWAAAIEGMDRFGELFGGSFSFIGDYQRVLDSGPPEWAGQCCHWHLWSEPDEALKDYHYHQWALTFGNGEGRQTSDPVEFYWPLNEVVVETPDLTAITGDVLELRFDTFTPFLAAFEVQVNDGPWQPLPAERSEGHRSSGRYRWALNSSRNLLRICSRNTAGRTGPVAMLEIAVPPYIPPSPQRQFGTYPSMGGLAAQGGRLYVPCGVIHVHDEMNVMTVGEAVDYPIVVHDPPAEPLTEAANIIRASQAALGQLFLPQACAVASDGTLIVADAENYRVHVFAPDSSPRAAWGRQGTGNEEFLHLRALAAAPDGTVYVADSGYTGPVGMRTDHMSRIRRFAADGRLLQVVAGEDADPGLVVTPAGLCCDAAGNLWVADSGNHRVQCFAPDGRLLAAWGHRGNAWGELSYPTDIAVTPDAAFVADPQHRCVWKYTLDGVPLLKLENGTDGMPWLRPGRLAIDGDLLYVGDTTTGLIQVFQL